ncbi:MAG: hypothetical protein V7727_02060 [Sneathiella sp.]
MPRNMSFMMTVDQFKNRSKTVTRRFGWEFLKPGDIVCGVAKAMGLKKGEKINRLGYIKILNVRTERLHDITQDDVIKEGFPHWTPEDFIDLLTSHYTVTDDSIVRRIEFEHVESE